MMLLDEVASAQESHDVRHRIQVPAPSMAFTPRIRPQMSLWNVAMSESPVRSEILLQDHHCTLTLQKPRLNLNRPTPSLHVLNLRN